jgi:ATP-dependent exoDNAse (exonuclease V) beta subunit
MKARKILIFTLIGILVLGIVAFVFRGLVKSDPLTVSPIGSTRILPESKTKPAVETEPTPNPSDAQRSRTASRAAASTNTSQAAGSQASSTTSTATKPSAPAFSPGAAVAKINRWFADENPASKNSPAILLRDHFQKQPVDPTWAPPATENIEKFLADNAAAIDTDVHILSVECRTNMCEILAIQPEWLAGQSGADFAALLSRVGGQSWFAGGFADIQTAFKSGGDGQQMILVYFIRNSPTGH